MSREALKAYPEIDVNGPYRWPLVDGTLLYVDRRGQVEWRAPRQHREQSPEDGVEWWWSVPLSEMIARLARLGFDSPTIALRLNAEQRAVDHFLSATEEARRAAEPGHLPASLASQPALPAAGRSHRRALRGAC
jgi:hypothetical protein